jgi:lipid II:glycine glycyltransferase (peptidoglycan interpeptide bridge formation enzyme)
VKSDCKAIIIDEAIIAFNQWVTQKKYKKVKIALPPMHYDTQFQTRLINGMRNYGFTIEQLDVNHHFQTPIGIFEECYPKMLFPNARNKLNNALKEDLKFLRLKNEKAKSAYDVIVTNRAAKNKPLRMSLEQIEEVAALTQIDFFVVMQQNHHLASAIVFHVNEETVQVVYWGDNPDFYEFRAMNFLSYKLFLYYSNSSIKTIDIGISTEDSIPNHGLCEFKESIGCEISLKYTMVKEFT